MADLEDQRPRRGGQDPQGFRRQGRQSVRSPDRPHHDRADGQGGRRHQSRKVAHIMAIPAFSLAKKLHAGETVYSGWCGLPYPLVAETLGARRLCRGGDRKPARSVGRRRHPQRHRRGPPGRRRADRARAAQRFRAGEPRARFRRRRHHRADDQYARPMRAPLRRRQNFRRSASAAGARTAP